MLTAARFDMESIDIFDKALVSPIAEHVGYGDSPRDNRRTERRDGIVPNLAGVSETMLWSLYNRASEAPTVHLSIPRAYASNRRSSITSQPISAFLSAHSQPALSKSTGRYGRG
jgi:hypothetical protein